MSKTEFSDFAKKLSVTFMGSSPPAEFAKALFAAIYLPISEDSPVEEMLLRTYKGYYYGSSNITRLAKQISGSLDLASFADEYTTETEASVDALCVAFAEDCPGINADNYSNMIAARFQRIILNAASPQKRTKKLPTATAAESVPVVSSSLKNRYGVYLVTEVGNCPNDGCTRSLYVRNNNQLEMVYDVAVIDPALPDDNTDNLIAMCPTCCARYNTGRTPDSIRRMKSIKKILLDTCDAHEITADQTVQEGIRFVIERIPQLPKLDNVDLNYDPVPVRRKIETSNDMLYSKAKSHVNIYYLAVNDVFMDLSTEGRLRFDPFCRQVRNTYLGLKDQGYDQDTIYFHLTKWLHETTNGNWNACEIVISYFIQKCEVFDVIPE